MLLIKTMTLPLFLSINKKLPGYQFLYLKLTFCLLLTLLTTLGFNIQANAALTDGLVAHYCFDDPNNIGKDCSSNGNNGFAEGIVNSTTGKIGSAASFGGVNNPSDIHVPNSSSLQFTDALTFSYFVKLDSFSGMGDYSNVIPYGYHAVIAKDHDWYGFMSRIDTSASGTGRLLFVNNRLDSNKDIAGALAGSFTNSQLKEWTHVALVISKQQDGKVLVSYFLNGRLLSSSVDIKTLDFTVANSKDLYIGKYSDTWYPLNGSVDEVRFYNRALSDAEVLALYDGNQQQQSIINNGNVETGNLSGWTATGPVVVASDTTYRTEGFSGNFTNGQYSIFFGSGEQGASSISQDFTTIPGQTYTLSFDYGSASVGSISNQSLAVSLTDINTSTNLLSTAVLDTTGSSNLTQIFNTYTFQFTAIGSVTRLTFNDISTETVSVDGALDNISVNLSTAPVAIYTLSQPLEVIYNPSTASEQMNGTVLGQCVYGGYCARKSSTLAHNGVDYSVAKGTPVYAICDGTVKKAVKGGAIASRFTVIEHSGCGGFNQLFAYYGHIDPIVKNGTHVEAGQIIGSVANWKANSHLQLSLNSKFVREFGYTNLKKSTPKNCTSAAVLERRTRLDAKGWLDPILIGSKSDWTPSLLKGGTLKTGCNATEQEYTDKSLPYAPWK